MNKYKKYIIVTLSIIAAFSMIIYTPIWLDDAEIKRNRMRVNTLINIGENLRDAETKLKDSGFHLLYEDPIAPTINRDYLQQIVVVGETQPNMFESWAYMAQLPWLPFTHSESPYVIINATLDGKITNIE